MKHLSTLKSLLLVLFAVLGGVNVWGQKTGSITFGTNATKINAASVTAPDNLGNSWTISTEGTTSFTANAAYYQVGSSKSPADLITFTTTLPSEVNVTSFSAKFGGFNNTAGTISLKVNDTVVGTGSLNTSSDVIVSSTSTAVGNVLTITVTDIAKGVKVYNLSYTYELSGTGPEAPSFSLAAGTFWSKQTTTITLPDGVASVKYTTDGSDPTTSETATLITTNTDIELTSTTTLRAVSYDSDGNASVEATSTYTFVPSIANTQATAYTTAQAKALIDERSSEQLGAEDQKVYVKGTVGKVDSYNSEYKSITYWLDDDAFKVYSGKGLDNTDFIAASDVEVGAEVIVYGNIKKFNTTTYEFDKNNYLVSYKAKVLSSVAISGSATKTSYEEGETFDFSGLTLTATYDKGSTMDITSSATWTASPETLTFGTTEVTVTATYNEKTATATIPVNVTKAFPTVTLDLSTDKTTTATTEKIEWVRDEFTINSVKGGATAANNYYGGDTSKRTSTRFYKDNSFNVIPALFVNIRKITYTATTDTYAAALANSTWTNATASADNTTVTIVPEDGTKTITAKIGATTGATSIVVTYEVVDNADITLVAQDGTDYYATFSSKKAVEFVDAQVYTVDVTGTKLKLNEVTSKQVPANEGVLIKSSTNTVTVKTIEAASGISSKNLLHASSFPMKESGYMFYKLAYGDWENKADLGFYWGAANGAAFTAKAGGAYLAVPTGEPAGVKGFAFGADEETAIESVEAEAANEEIFDLSGRKVSKAVKGLYIINGKKVVK